MRLHFVILKHLSNVSFITYFRLLVFDILVTLVV